MVRPLVPERSVGGPGSWSAWWLALCGVPAVAVLAALGLGGEVLLSLLAVPPALAGIGAATPRRPLAYGAVMLLVTVAVVPFIATVQSLAAVAVSVLV
ncbi:MAG TPA: hypothetical protein VIV12_19415, partial [Streptosporangiaceae bacterium]